MEHKTQNNRHDYHVALDIGTTKVVIVAGKLNDQGKIEILGSSRLANIGVEQGEIFNLYETRDSIRHVVEDLKIKYNLDVNKVSVGLSGTHLKIFPVTQIIESSSHEGVITQEDIDRLTNLLKEQIKLPEGFEILEIIPQFYRVDYEKSTRNPVGNYGKILEGNYIVVIADKEKIKKLEQSVKASGLQVDKIYLQSIASAQAVLTRSQMLSGTLLIDIGGGTTDILLIKDGVIRYLDVVPYGGDYITEAIRRNLLLCPETAEKIKIKHGSVLSTSLNEKISFEISVGAGNEKKIIRNKELAQIIQLQMEFITDSIMKNLSDYFDGLLFKNLKDLSIPGGIVLTGGGSQIKHLKQFFEMKFGHSVSLAVPNTHLTTVEFSKPMYSTVIGLLKLSLEENSEKKDGITETHEEDNQKVQPGKEPSLFDGQDEDFSNSGHVHAVNNEEETNGFFDRILKKVKETVSESK